MPTYEFTCKQCGHNFETMVPSADKAKVRCVKCEGSELQEKFGFNVSKGGAKGSSCAQSESCPSFGFG